MSATLKGRVLSHQESLERMITEKRAATTARILYPSDYHVSDCRSEVGREGLPCRVCLNQIAEWQERVQQVRAAMIEAFR